MNSNSIRKPKVLSYLACNFSSLLSLCFIIPLMIFTIMIIKLFVDGEIYKDRHGCWPISFYFGEKDGCRRMIYKNVDGFENIENTIKESNVVTNVFQIICKFLQKIYNNWINELTFISNKIVELNKSIVLIIYDFVI